MSLRSFDRLILHNGIVRTMDDADTIAAAIGFSGGRIAAVGTREQVRRAMPESPERDLAGATVYPGFIDAHHHFCFAATFAGCPEIRSPPVRSLNDILTIVAARVAQTPPGQWIVLLGFDEGQLVEQRKPTRSDLDTVAPAHPVLLIHFTYHEGVLNSAALTRAGFTENYPDATGGWLGRTRRRELDGRVYERCFGHAESVARTELLATNREAWFTRANAYQEQLLAAGITHVCDAAVPPDLEALYRAWHERGDLHVGVTMMPIADAMLADPASRLGGTVTGPIGGRLGMGPLKVFLDGGVNCAMCFPLRAAIRQFASLIGKALRAPASVPWRLALQQRSQFHRDGTVRTGFLYYDDETLSALLRAADSHDLGVAMHAAGNDAIRQALRGVSQLRRRILPARVDHFFFAEDDSLRRAAAEGVVAIVQPAQLVETGDWVLQTGLPGDLTYHAYRRMLDAGVPLVGSSDAPVVGFDVLRAIDTSVRRHLRSGAAFDRAQGITVREALHMYTRNAARVLGLNKEIGQLAPGARADAVVLSTDPQTIAPADLPTVRILSTFAGTIEHAK